jgi:hypothetical protein
MILVWIWDAIRTLLDLLLGLFPTVTMPTWVGMIADYFVQGVTVLNGMGNWVPLGAISTGLTFVLSCSAIAMTIRVARILISLFTGGGGSAA